MPFLRTLLYALCLWAGTTVLDKLPLHHEGVLAIKALLRPGAYLPFAAALAIGLHNHKGLLVILVSLTIVLSWPVDLERLAGLLVPIAAGLLLGLGARTMLREKDTTCNQPNNH